MSASIDARDADGRTPLMLAIANNQLDVVKVLVTRGADVVTARTAEGAVLAACICGVHGQDAAVVRRRAVVLRTRQTFIVLQLPSWQHLYYDRKCIIAASKRLPTAARYVAGLYAIHFCRSADVLRYLTTTTAVRVNMQSASGETLLHAASRRADVPVAAEAIALGANISAVDFAGNNALHIACHHVRPRPYLAYIVLGCTAMQLRLWPCCASLPNRREDVKAVFPM